MRPLYSVRVKKPTESKGEYDYYEVVKAVAPEDAWRPVADSACSLLKK